MTSEDSCRAYEVDGEPVSVRGAADLDETEQGYLAEVVRAARRRHREEREKEREEIAARARAEVAAQLRRAAESRRHYARNAPALMCEVLETEANAFEKAAKIAEGCPTCSSKWARPAEALEQLKEPPR